MNGNDDRTGQIADRGSPANDDHDIYEKKTTKKWEIFLGDRGFLGTRNLKEGVKGYEERDD